MSDEKYRQIMGRPASQFLIVHGEWVAVGLFILLCCLGRLACAYANRIESQGPRPPAIQQEKGTE